MNVDSTAPVNTKRAASSTPHENSLPPKVARKETEKALEKISQQRQEALSERAEESNPIPTRKRKVISLAETPLAATPLTRLGKKLSRDKTAQGEIALAQNRLEDAKHLFEAALQTDNKNIDALNGLGKIALDQNKLDEARHHYARVLDIDANFTRATFSLGVVALKQKKFDEAEKHFMRFLESHPKNIAALQNLGLVALNQNKLDEVKRCKQYHCSRSFGGRIKETKQTRQSATLLPPHLGNQQQSHCYTDCIRDYCHGAKQTRRGKTLLPTRFR
jgi:tetratricopeptide (TPR) repeat protein